MEKKIKVLLILLVITISCGIFYKKMVSFKQPTVIPLGENSYFIQKIENPLLNKQESQIIHKQFNHNGSSSFFVGSYRFELKVHKINEMTKTTSLIVFIDNPLGMPSYPNRTELVVTTPKTVKPVPLIAIRNGIMVATIPEYELGDEVVISGKFSGNPLSFKLKFDRFSQGGF